MQNIYYIADAHIGHQNVIRFDQRPFSSIEEMEEKLINNWNSVVGKNDIVYVLGDFIWYRESKWKLILEQLKGQIVLIRGNHDPKEFTAETKNYFVDIKDYKEIDDNGRKVIMCHYPIPFYKNDYCEDYYMLYGHVHNTFENTELETLRSYLKQNGKHMTQFINVGCMMPWMNYYPR